MTGGCPFTDPERLFQDLAATRAEGGLPYAEPFDVYLQGGLACVSRVYTDLAVFLIQPEGVVVRDLFGTGFAELTTLLDVPPVDGMQEAVS